MIVAARGILVRVCRIIIFYKLFKYLLSRYIVIKPTLKVFPS